MKILQRTIVVLFALVLLVFCLLIVHERFLVDRTAPELQCSSDLIEISVEDPDSVLLQGVTAMDAHDGDLTSKIIIKSITPLITNDTAKVSYVVFDAANNMATCTRTVKYVDYCKPRFSLTQPLVYAVGQTATLKDRLHATDSVDGDISDRICITNHNISTQYTGIYSVTVQVTNSLGDTASLPMKVVIRDNIIAQRIVLDSYILYLEVGDDFDPISHITRVCDAKNTIKDPSEVTIESTVNVKAVGVYDVLYSYDGYSVYMTVVVE